MRHGAVINNRIKERYLHAQLSLSLPSLTHPFLVFLAYDAGIFAGFEHSRMNGKYTTIAAPFKAVEKIAKVVSGAVEIATEVFLILKTITKSSQNVFGLTTSIMSVLAILPTILDIFRAWLLKRFRRRSRKERWRHEDYLRRLKWVMSEEQYKPEVLLFGLRDWLLAKWRELTKEEIEADRQSRELQRVMTVSTQAAIHASEELFHVSLAGVPRVLPDKCRC